MNLFPFSLFQAVSVIFAIPEKEVVQTERGRAKSGVMQNPVSGLAMQYANNHKKGEYRNLSVIVSGIFCPATIIIPIAQGI